MSIFFTTAKTRLDKRLFWDLLFEMTKKELTARYKNTYFGFLWIFVNPLLQMLVIGFIFRLFIKEPIENYYLYLLVGLLVWNFFSLSLNKATQSIVNERSLIKKAKFPREVIPISIVLSNFIHLLLSLILILVPVIYLKLLSIYNIPGLLFALFLLLAFTVGFSLITAAINVRFRDVNFFVQAILILWFYATPIVYSIEVVPHELMWLWRINPLTVIVQFFQSALVSATKPGLAMFIANTTIIVLVFILGNMIFWHESKNFDDWL